MNIEEYRDFCLALPAVTEDFPFDNSTLVFKVCGKIFALTGINSFESINLKCEPELALELREKHPAVQPGFHMNKKHWNTVKTNEGIPDKLLQEWIIHSYERVIAGLPKKIREELKK